MLRNKRSRIEEKMKIGGTYVGLRSSSTIWGCAVAQQGSRCTFVLLKRRQHAAYYTNTEADHLISLFFSYSRYQNLVEAK